MPELRAQIDDWLATVEAPRPPDLAAAIGRGRRLRRARSVGWSAAALVAAVLVAAAVVALRPLHHEAVVPARPRTQVRYPDGTVVAWPAPANGPWVRDGVTILDDEQNAAANLRLRDELRAAVPGSVTVDPAPGLYRVGASGPTAEYSASVLFRRVGGSGVQRAWVVVGMTRGGLGETGPVGYDPCGTWPGALNLGDTSRRAFERDGAPRCELRRDARLGWVVHAEHQVRKATGPYRRLSSFTVRPDGTAVSVWVEGHTPVLDAIRTAPAWQRLLDDLAATLRYPAPE